MASFKSTWKKLRVANRAAPIFIACVDPIMADKNDALSAYDPNKLKLCELFNKLHTKS